MYLHPLARSMQVSGIASRRRRERGFDVLGATSHCPRQPALRTMVGDVEEQRLTEHLEEAARQLNDLEIARRLNDLDNEDILMPPRWRGLGSGAFGGGDAGLGLLHGSTGPQNHVPVLPRNPDGTFLSMESEALEARILIFLHLEAISLQVLSLQTGFHQVIFLQAISV
jgi:hypothetical protein